jgi:cytochrome c oxidase subunit 3/cytochrome o ubiquinol oxidase subunit 3
MMLLSCSGCRWTAEYHRSGPKVVELVGLYWHFVDIVWIVIFTVVYLIPTK